MITFWLLGISAAIISNPENNLKSDSKQSKIKVNKSHLVNSPNKNAKNSSAAYITYESKEDAQAAIESVDMFQYDGRLLRASFGTSKYCNSFLRGMTCGNPDCLYLHAMGNAEDSVSYLVLVVGLARTTSGLADHAALLTPSLPLPSCAIPTHSLQKNRSSKGTPTGAGSHRSSRTLLPRLPRDRSQLVKCLLHVSPRD